MRTTEKESHRYLEINHCYYDLHCEYDNEIHRENGCIDYLFLYPVTGYFFVYEGKQKIRVDAGNLVIYRPHEPQHYVYKKNINCHTYCIHFTGTECETFLKKFNMKHGRIFNIGVSNSIIRLFEKIVRECITKDKFYTDMCNGYLIQIMAQCARNYKNNGIESHQYDRSEKINEICIAIHSDYASKKKPSDYAKLLYSSESKFYKDFKKAKGISPGQYLLNIRLLKAEELLDFTDLSICEICNMSGFSDQNYFSRVFKKHTNMTPLEYRNKLRNKKNITKK